MVESLIVSPTRALAIHGRQEVRGHPLLLSKFAEKAGMGLDLRLVVIKVASSPCAAGLGWLRQRRTSRGREG